MLLDFLVQVWFCSGLYDVDPFSFLLFLQIVCRAFFSGKVNAAQFILEFLGF